MPYPIIYSVTYSYTGFQQSQGNNAFPGTQIDADLLGLRASVSNLALFTQGVMRSDGALMNGIVTFDSLNLYLQTYIGRGAQGLPGPTSPSDYGARILAMGATIAAPVLYLRVAGYAAAGDGGAALYKRVVALPAGAYGFQSADGAWWQYADTNIYNVEAFGAKADLIARADGAITTGTATFNSASAAFVSTDVGKLIAIAGAGTSGALLSTTIAAYVSPNQVTLAVNASTTVSAAKYNYSTNSTAGIQAAANLAMANSGDVQFQSAGSYGVTSINLTNPTRAIRLLGVGPLSWGTTLVAMSNANAVIDATGHDAIQINNVSVSSGVASPNIGLLIAPSVAIPGIDVIRIENVRVSGYFGTATFYLDRIYGATFTNASSFQYLSSAATGFYVTKSNLSGVTSAFTTTKPYNSATDSVGSFTFLRCEFHNFSTSPTRPSMLLDGLVDSVWIGGLISGNGTTVTLSNNPTGLTFQGVQFSADNTTLSAIFSGTANYLVTINTNTGGIPLNAVAGSITNLTQIGRI